MDHAETGDLFGHKKSIEIFKENDVCCFYKGDVKYMRCKDIAAKRLEKPEDISRAHGWFRQRIPASDLIQMSKNTPIDKRGFYVQDKHLPAFVAFLNDDTQMQAVVQTGIAFAMAQAAKTGSKKPVEAPKLPLEPVAIEEITGEWITYQDLGARVGIATTTIAWHARDKHFPRRRRVDGLVECYVTADQITKLKIRSRPGCGPRKSEVLQAPTFMDRLREIWRAIVAKCNPYLLAYNTK